MSDRDFYNLREMIRRMQRRIDHLEKLLEEKSVTT
jgi:DNA-binding protein YbaB